MWSLPINLNRISWKLLRVSFFNATSAESLPINLNRISWKHKLKTNKDALVFISTD